MSYLSFLWKKTLRESAEMEEVIPQSVLVDLMLDGDMKPATLTYFRKPCTGEEIPQRQGLFRTLLADADFRDALRELAEQLTDLRRITDLYDRAETPTERTMLFLPVIARYLTLAETFAGLAGRDGRAGEIGRMFAEITASVTFREVSGEVAELLKNRRPELLYRIHGTEVHAAEGGRMIRANMEEQFIAMGVPEAIPNKKAMLRANASVSTAYAGVYFGFHASCERFYQKYASHFFDGENDIHLLFAYSDEIGFLLDASAYFLRLSDAGYPLTYPTVSQTREVVLGGIVDAALVKRDLRGEDVVPNDLLMASEHGEEREQLSFYIVTGANGGGKTTFIRACGLAVVFFLAGCPVTASSARMYPFAKMFTHFPANESFENSGRFVNEANRADEILEQTDADTFVLFNETYSGTDEQKSEQYSRRLADTVYERGAFGMFVTHIHSLTGSRIPTLAAVIDETDENRRTYKIKRVGATTSSFAADILEKYALDWASLQKKLERSGNHV